jgi:hypothetical protein
VNRLVVLVTALVALVTAATVVWMEVRQEREFRRLVAEGDAALDANRTSEAIEAFSGALAFKPDSMLAHLQRAETYRTSPPLFVTRGRPTHSTPPRRNPSNYWAISAVPWAITTRPSTTTTATSSSTIAARV